MIASASHPLFRAHHDYALHRAVLLSQKHSKSESFMDVLSAPKRQSLSNEVGKLRSIKSESEQAVMRAAADISSRAHVKVGFFSFP